MASSNYDNGPVVGGVSITPGASALVRPIRGFHCGVAGDVNVTLVDGSTLLLKNCQNGAYYPYMCTHILAANTTATNIIGLY